MLKRILFIAIIAVFSISANAQFHFGPKAGLNATKIDGKSFKEQFEYNYLVGAFAEIDLSSRFSVVPEVLFSQTSTTLAGDADATIFNTDQAEAKLNYLSLPILANVKIAGPLRLEAGPQYSILINSDEDLLQNGKDAFKKGDFSLVGGLQLRFNKLRLTGRYLIGLDDISQASNQEEWKKQSIQVTLGFSIF